MLRNNVPWYAAGMYPAVQLEGPLMGPPRGSVITTKAGKVIVQSGRPQTAVIGWAIVIAVARLRGLLALLSAAAQDWGNLAQKVPALGDDGERLRQERAHQWQ